MKKLCKNCFYWHRNKSSYCTAEGVAYGDCVCVRFVYKHDNSCPYSTDQLVYWDYEGFDAGFATGPEFGCVQWREKKLEVKV